MGIAGTAFGRFYAEAVAAMPGCRLAGLLSRGRPASRRLAARYGVPCWTRPEEVPAEVDAMCVVVGSTVLGGPGTELALELIGRGHHVLQEHPVAPADILACVRAARQTAVAYRVNTLYPALLPVRRFLAAATALRERGPLRFLDAATNSQVALPLIDMLARTAGGLAPWAFGDPVLAEPRLAALSSSEAPFTALPAVIGGVPATLRVQNQVHPADPDNHSHLIHRISAGTDAGVLTLADTHGPVLWHPRKHAPRDAEGRLRTAGEGTERFAAQSTSLIGPPAESFHTVFAARWPEAISSALDELRADAADPARRIRAGQHAIGVAQAWQDLTRRLGLPALIAPETPPTVPVEVLREAAAAID
ncbi:Gfo/Idh/MocA family oxidoreductase [Amycolatopsis sp. A1MSW2902]|uniref:Gfo/Idh/MocA family oxidoreductase n=1 Tax=Amycolatopsis sp. A1MSW2902 TaxID=687413 RepID=UPI00307DB7CF